MNYPRLFSPITIKPGFTLKKPYLHAAIHSGLSEDGSVNARFTEYYKARAVGGAGLLVIGACRFNGKGGKPNVMHIDSDADITMWRAFTDELHAAAPRLQAGAPALPRRTLVAMTRAPLTARRWPPQRCSPVSPAPPPRR